MREIQLKEAQQTLKSLIDIKELYEKSTPLMTGEFASDFLIQIDEQIAFVKQTLLNLGSDSVLLLKKESDLLLDSLVMPKIQRRAKVLIGQVVPVYTDNRQYKVNFKSQYKADALQSIIDFLKKHHRFIGQSVYQFKGRNAFTLKPNNIGLNQTLDTPVIFTEEMYFSVEKDFLTFRLERIASYFLEGNITNNSTCKLSNLCFELKLEAQQELAQFYAKLLNDLG